MQDWVIELEIKKYLAKGINRFIIFPYGYYGKRVKKILNDLDIPEIAILDNYETQDGCQPVNVLREEKIDKNTYILFSSERIWLKQLLSDYIADDKVLDLLNSQYGVDVERKVAGYKNQNEDDNRYYTIRNSKFVLPMRLNDAIQRHIYTHRGYYEEMLLFYYTHVFQDGRIGDLIKEGITLDIGANIGNHTLYYANECSAKKIVSIEPVKGTFEILEKNIEINNLRSVVTLINAGVGEEEGCADIDRYDKSNIGATALKVSKHGNIRLISIDELSIRDKVVLIKIDTEGFEDRVLKGSLNLIKRDLPYIVVEAWGGSILNILDIMIPLGYCFEQISDCDYIFYFAK